MNDRLSPCAPEDESKGEQANFEEAAQTQKGCRGVRFGGR
jgi:hypothetical protein